MHKVILTVCLLMAASINLSACANTVDGVGKDMESAGQSIQKKF